MKNHLNLADPIGDPCHTCGSKSTRRVAAKVYCDLCCDGIVDDIAARIAMRNPEGGGRPGAPAAGHGPGHAWLTCIACGAEWVERPWTDCLWCDRSEKSRCDRQRLLLLHPELPDRDDDRRGLAIKAWAERLAVAVDAGQVTEHEGRGALGRQR